MLFVCLFLGFCFFCFFIASFLHVLLALGTSLVFPLVVGYPCFHLCLCLVPLKPFFNKACSLCSFGKASPCHFPVIGEGCVNLCESHVNGRSPPAFLQEMWPCSIYLSLPSLSFSRSTIRFVSLRFCPGVSKNSLQLGCHQTQKFILFHFSDRVSLLCSLGYPGCSMSEVLDMWVTTPLGVE